MRESKGLGSCSGNGELIEVIVDKVLKPLLVGMDPTRIEEIWDKAYVRGGHKEFGTRGIGVVALSGIDIALWDILGKVRGLSIYQLLGGKCRDKVPVYATALYPEEPFKVAKRALLRRTRISRSKNQSWFQLGSRHQHSPRRAARVR